MSLVKHLVSKKKRRLIVDGYDLDLTCIPPYYYYMAIWRQLHLAMECYGGYLIDSLLWSGSVCVGVVWYKDLERVGESLFVDELGQICAMVYCVSK